MATRTVRSHRLVSIDDDPQFQAQLAALLSHLGLELTYKANRVDEVLDELGRECPDLILLDVWMDGVNELKSIPELRARCDVPIVVLSLQEEDEYRSRALELGAAAYVRKGRVAEELPDVVHRVLGG